MNVRLSVPPMFVSSLYVRTNLFLSSPYCQCSPALQYGVKFRSVLPSGYCPETVVSGIDAPLSYVPRPMW